jgi:hypothetical protein
MAPRPPDAFLSYTRFDDRTGYISAFREHLEDAVREVTGDAFEIFQDVDGIGLGQHWPSKLDQLLDQARFFIPILTPNYFRSEACRDELGKFLKAEKDRKRNDLVLPIYHIQCPILDDPDLRKGDQLAKIIYERQRWDWHDLRHHSFRTRKVRLALEALARQIDKAADMQCWVEPCSRGRAGPMSKSNLQAPARRSRSFRRASFLLPSPGARRSTGWRSASSTTAI